MINRELKNYIETKIFPQYALNDSGHQIDHIKYTIRRSLLFAKSVPNVNLEMVYSIAAYHDVGHHLDAAHHERISSQILRNDQKLQDFFSTEEIDTMAKAIEDHRSTNNRAPRNIYGKIIVTADKTINVNKMLTRTYAYRVHTLNESDLNTIIEESRQHLIDKYGPKGYALEKSYFLDPEFDQALKELWALLSDKAEFRRQYMLINNL